MACGRRGFSLIEAAIVLGIVGLVIGGIWVAASAVTESRKMRLMIEGTLQIIEKERKLYRNIEWSGDYLSAEDGWKMGIFPAGYTYDTVNDYVLDPYGNFFDNYTDTERINLTYFYLTPSRCMKLVAAIAGKAARGYRLTSMRVGSTSTTTFPFLPTATDCASPTVNVEFWFQRR